MAANPIRSLFSVDILPPSFYLDPLKMFLETYFLFLFSLAGNNMSCVRGRSIAELANSIRRYHLSKQKCSSAFVFEPLAKHKHY